MLTKIKERWRAWRWHRFIEACRRWGMVPYPMWEARETSHDLDSLIRFTSHSGFLRDGRYPGGRHAERKIHRTIARVAGRLGTRKVP